MFSRGAPEWSWPHPVRRIGWGHWALALVVMLGASAELSAQGTPAGTRITSIAKVTFEAENGLTFTVFADPAAGGADMVVGRVGGVALETPGASIADPGVTVLFRHTIRNIGNAPDSFTVSASSRASWPLRIYTDLNGNGLLDPGEPLVLTPISLGYGGSAALLLAVDIPAQAPRGITDTLQLAGASRFDPTADDQVMDLVQIRSPGIVVTLEKAVDRPIATLGDILTYTITYRSSGTSPATNLVITDPVPTGTRYVAGTLRLNGVSLTDASGDDPGSFDAVSNRVAVVLSMISPGDTGVITFQVRVGS